MAHITRTEPEVYTVNDHELRDYLQAGYRLASAEEYHHWARTSGRGRQRAPRAPALDESSDAESDAAAPEPEAAGPESEAEATAAESEATASESEAAESAAPESEREPARRAGRKKRS